MPEGAPPFGLKRWAAPIIQWRPAHFLVLMNSEPNSRSGIIRLEPRRREK